MSIGGFFKTVGKVGFPFLSAAAVAGGPFATMAAASLGKALGIDTPESNPDAIADVMAKATLDPLERAKLIQAENEFKLQMATLNINHEDEIEKIAAADRDSARNREIQVRDKTPQVGFYCLLLGFFGALSLLFWIPIPDPNKATIYGMIGSLGTLLITAATYYYGTNASSSRKTELLAQAAPVDGEGAKK